MKQLFVYGLLQEERLQRRLFNRTIEQEPHELTGFAISDKLVNGLYKTIVPDFGDSITKGTILYLEDEELEITDRFEGVSHGLYTRTHIKQDYTGGSDFDVYIHEVTWE